MSPLRYFSYLHWTLTTMLKKIQKLVLISVSLAAPCFIPPEPPVNNQIVEEEIVIQKDMELNATNTAMNKHYAHKEAGQGTKEDPIILEEMEKKDTVSPLEDPVAEKNEKEMMSPVVDIQMEKVLEVVGLVEKTQVEKVEETSSSVQNTQMEKVEDIASLKEDTQGVVKEETASPVEDTQPEDKVELKPAVENINPEEEKQKGEEPENPEAEPLMKE